MELPLYCYHLHNSKAEVPFHFLFKSYNRSLFPAIRRGASAILVVITAKAHRISKPPKYLKVDVNTITPLK